LGGGRSAPQGAWCHVPMLGRRSSQAVIRWSSPKRQHSPQPDSPKWHSVESQHSNSPVSTVESLSATELLSLRGLSRDGSQGTLDTDGVQQHAGRPTVEEANLVLPDEAVQPIAALLTTFQLGAVRHGEVLLLYRTLTGEYALDVLDQMAVPVNSAFDSAFLTSAKAAGASTSVDLPLPPSDSWSEQPLSSERGAPVVKTRLQGHHIRAFTATPDRGFKLDDRRVFAHLDLVGVTSRQVHNELVAAIRGEDGLHVQGFSYVDGKHCIRFANQLMLRLLPIANGGRCAFGVLPAVMAHTQAPLVSVLVDHLAGHKHNRSPRFGNFLREAKLGDAYAQFVSEEQEVRQQELTVLDSMARFWTNSVDPGDFWTDFWFERPDSGKRSGCGLLIGPCTSARKGKTKERREPARQEFPGEAMPLPLDSHPPMY